MTMIERVARAIYSSRLLVQPREPWGSNAPTVSVTEKMCLETARAVLEAMREPPDWVGPMLDTPTHDGDETWSYIVEALLQEGGA